MCESAYTEIYTLSLHDALPISTSRMRSQSGQLPIKFGTRIALVFGPIASSNCSTSTWYVSPVFVDVTGDTYQVDVEQFERSEEHTSELQSRLHLVCRLLLEKKK